MPTLHVCPLAQLADTAAASGAADLVTLINVGTPVERPASIAAARHCVIAFSDITEARDGHVLPTEAHVRALIAFAEGWDRARPLLLHCYAGISRSTAAAYIAACALQPWRDEAEIARALRAAAPSATPNPLLVAIADRVLARDGRMRAAIAAIGRGAEAFSGQPFMLDLQTEPPGAPAQNG